MVALRGTLASEFVLSVRRRGSLLGSPLLSSLVKLRFCR
jgi:hypothetical protein